MKKTFRLSAALLSLVLCVGLLAACGGQVASDGHTKAPSTDPAPSASATTGTESFVAPPDAIGLVVFADSELITWYAYGSDKETIDFMGVDVKSLGDAASEMSLYYLESDVTYYLIKDGKLVDATVEDLLPQSVVGVTTLEDGVQEVYILYQPTAEDEDIAIEDDLEEVVDEFPTETTAAVADDSDQEGDPSDGENG